MSWIGVEERIDGSKRNTDILIACLWIFFSCRLLCTGAILGGSQRDTKGWVGCGGVEKLK